MTDLSKWDATLLHEHLTKLIEANDAQYKQRFASSELAVKDALLAQEKAINAALMASEKAIDVAAIAADKWRASANEWRDAMNDREARFASKSEVALQMKSLDSRMSALEALSAAAQGKGAGITIAWMVFLGFGGLLLTAATVVLMLYK